MKKLKSLSAIIAAAGILSFTSPAFAQVEQPPKYDKTTAIKHKVMYAVLTPFGTFPINGPEEAEGSMYVKYEMYGIDMNKDGKLDLVHIDIMTSSITYQDELGKEVTEPERNYTQVVVDTDFDGYIEKQYSDIKKADGTDGADGIFDQVQEASKIEDIFQ